MIIYNTVSSTHQQANKHKTQIESVYNSF